MMLRTAGLVGLLIVLALSAGAAMVVRPLGGPTERPHPGILATVELGSDLIGGASIAVDGRRGRAFIVTANDGRMRVLDTRTGIVRATIVLRPRVSSVAVDRRTGRAFMATGGVNVATYDARTGHLGSIAALLPTDDVAVDERTGHVFAAHPDSATVSMLDGSSGRLLLTTSVGASPAAMVIDPQSERVFVANGTIVSVLNTRTGLLEQTIIVGAGDAMGLLVAQNARRLFVATDDSTVAVFDADSGQLVSSSRTMRSSPVAMADDERLGHVFVVNADGFGQPVVGSVSMFDARTGAMLRTTPVGKIAKAIAVDQSSSRVFVANAADGSVSVLDARSGRLLRSIVVGGHPLAVAVDERTGRAVVVADGGERDLAGWGNPAPPPRISVLDATR